MISGKLSVLVVEDDQNITELLKFSLESQGYSVFLESHGDKALQAVLDYKPDAVILDLCLPGMNGIEICKKIREQKLLTNTAVIMLTAKTLENDIVVGFDAGADDYILKPFSPKVLFARLKNALRKKSTDTKKNDNIINLGLEFSMLPECFEVRFRGREIPLTSTEFNILKFLAQHPGIVFSRDQIINDVKGTTYAVTLRTIDVHIASLRKKLGLLASSIDSVRGVGYRFKNI